MFGGLRPSITAAIFSITMVAIRSRVAVVEYLKAWLDVGKDFKQSPGKAADVIFTFYTSKGYTMTRETLGKALANVEVDVGFPAEARSYLQQIAEGLLKEKKISAVPDWNKALRSEFMAKARG